jgi:predicted nucleic acid-binding protein
VLIAPGPRHWEIFERLCVTAGAKGNLVPDAHLAALAIESGSELVTTDRDFSRFPGLRWRHPLAEA